MRAICKEQTCFVSHLKINSASGPPCVSSTARVSLNYHASVCLIASVSTCSERNETTRSEGWRNRSNGTNETGTWNGNVHGESRGRKRWPLNGTGFARSPTNSVCSPLFPFSNGHRFSNGGSSSTLPSSRQNFHQGHRESDGPLSVFHRLWFHAPLSLSLFFSLYLRLATSCLEIRWTLAKGFLQSNLSFPHPLLYRSLVDLLRSTRALRASSTHSTEKRVPDF